MSDCKALRLENWKDKDISVKYVDALDGVRVLSILLVLWFHFWQQTWLMPTYETPFLAWLGIDKLDPAILRRVGFIFVDMMMFLSAFCLFLPYARWMFLGEPEPDVKAFYRRRVARIFPSYYLCIFILLAVAIAQNLYRGSMSALLWDFGTHLTFTQMFRVGTYMHTQLNGGLWAVVIEMQFYLLLPWIAKLFKKFHLLVLAVMMGIGVWYTWGPASTYLAASLAGSGKPVLMVVNQFPSFLPVFALGMGCACLFVLYVKHCKWKRLLSIPMTAVSIFALMLIWKLTLACTRSENIQIWQLMYRIPLAGAFVLFVLPLSLSAKPWQRLFGNPIAKWLAGISFNLYIWHQLLIVWMRKSYGFASGADAAAAGANMQWSLTVLGLIVSIAVAWIVTKLVEKPFAKLILAQKKNQSVAVSDNS